MASLQTPALPGGPPLVKAQDLLVVLFVFLPLVAQLSPGCNFVYEGVINLLI